MIQEQLIMLLGVILTAIVAYVSTSIKKWLNAKLSNEQLEQGRKYAEIIVHAIEQIYRESGGQVKFEKAKENLVKMLNDNKVKISEDQIDYLIEAVVNEMNRQWKNKE